MADCTVELDLERYAALADELHALGAGTPEYAMPEAIGEGADAIRDLVAALQQARAERDDKERDGRLRLRAAEAEVERLRAIASAEVAAHDTQVARLASEKDRLRAAVNAVSALVSPDQDDSRQDRLGFTPVVSKRSVRAALTEHLGSDRG